MIKEKFMGILLAFVLILNGCTSVDPASSKASPASSGSRMVTDAFDRQVELPEKIETIAAIGGAARILTYAGCADKLVGVTDMDKQNQSAMPYSVINAQHFATLASVGSGGNNDTCYIEELVTLGPDVIFALTDEDTINNVAQKTGIPVIGIYPDGMFDQSFYSALELIGQVMGTREHCAKVINYVQNCQKDLDHRTKDIPDKDKPSVYTGAVSFRGAHGFEGTYAHYPPFTAIHAKNVVDETGGSGPLLIDLEKVTVWNPDIIFLNPTNMNLVNKDYAKNKKFYDSLQAVQKDKVYAQISYNYNWTNLEIAIADAYYAGKIIYPERFADIDPIKKADEIFTIMLGEPFYHKLAADGYRFDKITIGE
ncbi:iron ABC transporter substrate-binding protein [Desulforamulus ruminis]|uniref:Periplasmic binding protein n=1 Tax=Desulforamulus ruminis (strain ATCC 23193 / DSM 2154 / NCIMB 8452 / DL) TaxID=696281 RepID=F6DSY3_DESRL|nr:iron ABC transporter substrate-binding protein [Desulforamulus ruminis]AEG59977.1 periplasmic binding protein [Desulforamulus ruminis DSM 2154]